MSYAERFEIIGDLYRGATGYLRPGKDEPAELRIDSSSEENRARFDNWFATRGFTDAIAQIARLQKDVELLTHERDAARDALEEAKATIARFGEHGGFL